MRISDWSSDVCSSDLLPACKVPHYPDSARRIQTIRMNSYDRLPTTLELTDGQLCLRPWQEHDASALVEAARESTDTVGRWLPWCHTDYGMDDSSEERRVGKEGVSPCRSRWSPYH